MEDWIAQLLGETGLVAFCAALWKISKIVETRLSAPAKAQLAEIIQAPSNSVEVVSAFSTIIKDAFDKLFKTCLKDDRFDYDRSCLRGETLTLT